MNPLFNMMGNNNFMAQLNRLKQTFNGDPAQKIQEMLNSGKISQEQYNRAVQQAQYLQNMMK